MTAPVIGHLNVLDITVIFLFLVVIILISAYYTRAAGKDISQFFLSGRNLPWYLAGTAMVATTFAADTPLAVTELVAKNGIAGNWLWWNMAFGGLLTVFFFSRMWRRSGMITDLEFVEFRYSGRAAAILRGFRAIYLGLFMNAIVLGWVHKAMEKIFQVTLPGFDPFLLVVALAIIISVYASASGLLGTARTDSFQFVFALTGCIILAIIVVRLPEVGGLAALKSKLQPEILDFFPKISHSTGMNLTGGVFALTAGAFAAYVGIQWWSSWYPGADPGGGGYIAQRMMSAKDERHSLLATLWFNIAHYTLRPWPWILVALAALVLLPRKSSPEQLERANPALFDRVVKAYESKEIILNRDHSSYSPEFMEMYETYENTIDPGIMYPKLMVRYLPAGLLGLLIAVFMAAYMSTIASQLNWGTSYIINDFYKRFIRTDATEKHYVLISRVGIVLMMFFSLFIAKIFLTTIKGAWEFIINASAGMGAVLILRWFWWRINAWSEIAAMIAPVIIYPVSVKYFGLEPPLTLYPTVLGTTIIWLAVTFITKPVDGSKLARFYKVIHPGGPGWKKYKSAFPEIQPDTHYGRQLVNWICGIISIYAVMNGTGKVIFHEYLKGIAILLVAIVAGYIIYLNIKKS
jgi:SSS family solute:Na+ symporter